MSFSVLHLSSFSFDMLSSTHGSLSTGADLVLFVLVLLGIGGAFVALYPALTAEPPEPWNQQATEDQAMGNRASHRAESAPKLMSQFKGEVPQVLRGNPLDSNPLDGISARNSRSTQSRPSWRLHAGRLAGQTSGWGGASGRRSGTSVSRSWAPADVEGRRASRTARSARTPRPAGSDPGGWAGALASSRNELRQLERQVGAIERQLRASSRASAAERIPAWANADESITGPAFSMDEPPDPPLPGDPLNPNPPLPPDPVPVDGGLVLLALAGGTYGWRRLRTSDAAAPHE